MFRKTILSLPAYAQQVNGELQGLYVRLFCATTLEEKNHLQKSIDYWANIFKRDRLGSYLPNPSEEKTSYALRVENELKHAEEELLKAKGLIPHETDKFFIANSNKNFWQLSVKYWREEKEKCCLSPTHLSTP